VVAERWVQALTAHDLEAAVACFAPDFHDEAPARRGEFIHGNAELVRDAGGIDAQIERMTKG
jgi:hypothetical protein